MFWHRLKRYLTKLATKFAILIGLPLTAAIYALKKGYDAEVILGGSGYLILLCLFFLCRSVYRFLKGKKDDPQKDKLDLWGNMIRVYENLGNLAISPTFIRQQLATVSDKGAIWPSAVFTILDNVINRNPAIWGVDDNLKYEK
jgi:hypothetical protein